MSKIESSSASGDGRVEAVVWLVMAGHSLGRAFLASGVGASFARQGLNITLLEVGRGLPNIGYYFGLEPAEYLAPTLDESLLVTGGSNSFIRYVYAADHGAMMNYQPEYSSPRYPHMVVVAFSCYPDVQDEIFFQQINLCSSRFLWSEVGRDHVPDGVVIFEGLGSGGRCERIVGTSRKLNPGTVIFLAGNTLSDASKGAVDERILFPTDLSKSWSKRLPPSGPFFTDLVSGFLQVLSHRRRRAAKDAVV